MCEKELKQYINTLQIYWWIITITVAISLLIIGIKIDAHTNRLNNIDCALAFTPLSPAQCKRVTLQPTLLAGWSEECIQNKTIEKHEYIENPKLSNSELIDCGLSCGAGVIEGIDGTKFVDYANNLNPHCITSCMDNKERELKPFVRFWNETVCVKKMLVKEAIE